MRGRKCVGRWLNEAGGDGVATRQTAACGSLRAWSLEDAWEKIKKSERQGAFKLERRGGEKREGECASG